MSKSTVSGVSEAVSELCGAIQSIFAFFSADERRKRRKLASEERLRKAINEEELHYVRLNAFLDSVEDLIDKAYPEPKNEKRQELEHQIKQFRKDQKLFLKRT